MADVDPTDRRCSSTRAKGAWCSCHDDLTVDHVIYVHPPDDLIVHELTPEADCPCGPSVLHVQSAEAGDFWVITHHSLDGREHPDSNEEA